MLFYDCLKVILSSISLIKHGTQVLPKRIAHLALFIACKSSNYSVIQAILTTWPHSEISFDFMTNSLCRKYLENQEDCLDVQEYFNIKCSKLFNHCIPSIALGIFYNTLEQQMKKLEPVFSEINLSKLCLTEDSNAIFVLSKLAEGQYPVNHPNNYLSSSDIKAIPLAKPKLHSTIKKITLVLNVEINTYAAFNCLQKIWQNSYIFNVVITGISLYAVPQSQLSDILCYFSSQHFSIIRYDASSMVTLEQKLPKLQTGGCLCLFSWQKVPLYHHYSSMFDLILSDTTCKPITLVVANYEKELFNTFAKIPICAIAVSPNIEYSYSKLSISCDGLISLLQTNSSTLEYVQLNKFPTSLVENLNIHTMTNLRVLSITSSTSKGHSLSSPLVKFCQVLKYFNLLEFLEWGDVINIFIKDLIVIHNTLKEHLPRLLHWHMHSFKLVLFTVITDSEKSIIGSLYKSLMESKRGSEECSTYKFSLNTSHMKNWLQQARPNICIKLDYKTSHN